MSFTLWKGTGINMREITGGVCAAKGFSAAGVHCGIRKNTQKRDLALILASVECAAAAVYTTNLVKAAPILVTMRNLENGRARAIMANSGVANACAPGGAEAARRSCEALAAELGIGPDEIVVNSTGVIGVPLPVERMEAAMPALRAALSGEGGDIAAEAIMTTDTVPKQAAVQVEIGGKTVTVGGMAKGSGMIHPNMATMLAFVTTDCAISPELLREALRRSAVVTYNRISVDGDTSTNDMTAILASGLAENPEITEKGEDYEKFLDALNHVNGALARMIARDGEGATRLVRCAVRGARSEEDAERLSMSVISSSLVKAAMFGADANWGRVLCALGYSGVSFKPELVDVSFSSAAGEIQVCRDGAGLAFDEARAKEILLMDEIAIVCDLKDGEYEAETYGCDLTYDYVRINGDYRS